MLNLFPYPQVTKLSGNISIRSPAFTTEGDSFIQNETAEEKEARKKAKKQRKEMKKMKKELKKAKKEAKKSKREQPSLSDDDEDSDIAEDGVQKRPRLDEDSVFAAPSSDQNAKAAAAMALWGQGMATSTLIPMMPSNMI